MNRLAVTLLIFLLPLGAALGANCQSNANGNWSAAGTWVNCNGTTPQAADTVLIRGGNTVTMNTTASVASLQVGSTNGNNTSTLRFNAGSSLTVAGTITMSGNSATRNGAINMTNGGTLIANGSPAFAFGAGTETWTPGTGTVQLGSTNTLPYSAAFSSFNDLIIAAGTTTLGGATTITGDLTVNGTLAGTTTLALTGAGASIDGTGAITNTGAITITNNKTVLGTAVLEIAGPVTVSTGTTTNNGTLCFGLSGGGTCPSITGDTLTVTSTLVNAGTINTSSAISVGGTLTNTGTVTTTDTATGIGGAGTFTNSANSTLNIAGPLTVTTFTATAAGNTVNYNGSGAQSVRATSYYNLTFSGTRAGNVTLPNGGTINVAGAFSPTATFTSGGYVITGNTFNYNGTGPQTIAAFNYNNLTISGARTTNSVTLASSGTIGIAATFSTTATFTTGGYVITGSTVDFNGTGAQTVPAFSYNNLTLSGARTGANSVTLVNGGTINVAGSFSPTATFGTGNYVVTGNTVNFNGTGAQTIPAFNFSNLTVSGARTTNSVTLVNGGTIGVAAAFSATATFTTGGYVITGNTVDFNGTGAQTVTAFNYNNLTISGARTTNNVTLANGGTVGIAAVFNPSATFTTGGYVVTNNTVEYNGSAAQTLNAFSFAGLRVNNASGLTLSAGNATVSGTLTLTTGVVTTTGTNTVITTSSCALPSVSRVSGHIAGRLQKAIPTGSTSCVFQLGDSSAATYTPLTATYTSITTGGNVLAAVTSADHPSLSGSGIDTTKSVNRYWTVSTPVTGALPSAAAGNTYSAVFTFVAGDVDAGAATGAFLVMRYAAGTWSTVTTGARTATTTQATGLALTTGYGDLAIGEAANANFARERQFIYSRELY